MSGSTPIVTNSVVPIAKPPMARATTATTTRRVLGARRRAVGRSGLAHSLMLPRAADPGAFPEVGDSAQTWRASQPEQVRGRGRAAWRAGRQPLQAGLPDDHVVPGLGQLGVAEQELGTPAAQDRLAEQGRHPLPGGATPGACEPGRTAPG